MEPNKHKRNHVVIVTSDAEDASVRQFRIKPWVIWVTVIVVCIVIGALLGYIAYEDRIWDAAKVKIEECKQQVEEYKLQLEEKDKEKSNLNTEIEELNNKITVLSDTINQLKVVEADLEAQINKYATPTLLPITGSATIEEVTEGEPASIFNAAEGAVVVSTASGTVAEIGEDGDYGHRIVIDHGNGYQTVYRNQGDPLVATGDTVAQGTTLFVIGADNTRLGYQILKDGTYVKPSEMMEIKG